MSSGADPDVPGVEVAQVIETILSLSEQLMAGDDPRMAGQVRELLEAVDLLHRAALERILATARDWRGDIFVDALTADPVTAALLDAYDLLPSADRPGPAGEAPPGPGGERTGTEVPVRLTARPIR